MSDGYTKLFASIVDSTIWQEDLATKVVWITMLAMADREGYVGASVPGLAARSGVTVEQCREALSKFMAPDPDSRTSDNEGRRVAVADRGWTLLNHAKFRDMKSVAERREQLREAQQRQRVIKRHQASSSVITDNQQSSEVNKTSSSASASASPEADQETTKTQSAGARDAAEASLPTASRGRARLREVDGGLLDFDHHGRWQSALKTIAGYPAKEWAIAATTFAQVAQDPERRGFLTPQHIVDYWHVYSAGDTPGPKGADWKEQAAKADARKKMMAKARLDSFKAESELLAGMQPAELRDAFIQQRWREYSELHKQLHGKTS